MTAVLSLCPAPGCRTLTLGGRCESHAKAENARRHAKQRAHGRDIAAWRGRGGLREQCLDLAGGRCMLRLEGCTGKATTVHIDAALGGRHDLATLADCTAACAHCHGVVDAPRAARAAAAAPGPLAESLAKKRASAPPQPPARNVHHAVADPANGLRRRPR